MLLSEVAYGFDKTTVIEEISLLENDTRLTLFADATCHINDEEKLTLNEENNKWESIVSHSYIESLSALAILEQVKLQIRRTRILLPIDKSNPTELRIKYKDKTRRISLYSINTMHETYPDAKLLAYFVDIVNALRSTQQYCRHPQ
jgi:hypothetical protein